MKYVNIHYCIFICLILQLIIVESFRCFEHAGKLAETENLLKERQDIFVARAIKKGLAELVSAFYFSNVPSYIFQAEANLFRSWHIEQNIPWVVRCETQCRTKTLITRQCVKALLLKVQVSPIPFHGSAFQAPIKTRARWAI